MDQAGKFGKERIQRIMENLAKYTKQADEKLVLQTKSKIRNYKFKS